MLRINWARRWGIMSYEPKFDVPHGISSRPSYQSELGWTGRVSARPGLPPGRNLLKLDLAKVTLTSGLSIQIGVTFLSRLKIDVVLQGFDVLRVVSDWGWRYRWKQNKNVYLSIPFNISLISDFIPSILFFLKSRSERFKLRNPESDRPCRGGCRAL